MSKAKRNNWRSLLTEFERSGLSVAEFCKQHDLKPQAFYTQRSKYRKRDAANGTETDDFIALSNVMMSSDGQEPISIHCGNVNMSVPATVDINYLIVLVKGLRA